MLYTNYLLKVRETDTKALGRLVRERIAPLKGVVSTDTTIVMNAFQETARIPIDDQDLRTSEIIKSTILLVFLPVFCVASMATYNKYETIDAPCLILYKIGEQKSGVISVDLIISEALIR
ncbi:MAG: Lrp/AsnC ligand binding domain-containing protein [Desulfosarcina sp.]|nr:Lrp/AsnC ligand binding domain-containing protein [Desulfosarcina sp.]MBC2744679.1 Lrp/AsnC ligand binding domain-containing protein [Desulfosarcina sp.]MBC2767588.1 Lrp/AsnC family transcriptional regulator [Desulfosarcina sp.]